MAAGWLASTLVGAGVGAATGGLVGSLTNAGIDEADAHSYAEGVKRGGTLVTVRADDSLSKRVADIFDDHGTINMDECESSWRTAGSTAGAPAATTTGALGATAVGDAAARDVRTAATGEARSTGVGGTTFGAGLGTDDKLQVIEERLRVGKREENRGRVRIHTRLIETPVQEQVTLHNERVTIDRRPVDRPVSGIDEPFGERTIEAVETTEVPVVDKEARVEEEIAIRKEASDRVETVSDKVRRTEVEVDDERGTVDRTGTTGAARPVR